MVVVAQEDRVNHGWTTSRNEQASHCCRCCVSQTTEVDGQPLQRRRLWETERCLGVTGVSLLVRYTQSIGTYNGRARRPGCVWMNDLGPVFSAQS